MTGPPPPGAPGPPGTPPPPGGTRPWPRIGRLRRLGPAVLVVAALVGVGVLASVAAPGPGAGPPAPAGPARPGGPALPVTYQAAAARGLTGHYEWGPGCDRGTGRIRMPTVYAPPCVPAAPGPNGGTTGPGVSSSTITVAYYQPPAGDLLASLQGAAGDTATNFATAEAYVSMLNRVVETYGRRVRLVAFNATGISTDAVAARADALTVAQQLHAFASISGPAQTTAYQDELAREHVLCIACGLSVAHSGFLADAPYLWGSLPAPDTLITEALEFVVGQLLGKDAVYAGNAAFRHERRVFATVHYDQNPPVFGNLTEEMTRRFSSTGLRMAFTDSYLLDLPELPAEAATIAAHLKHAGVTTVIFAGDPIMPIYLTKACAAIGYFPEWVVTGTVYTDSSTLARLYDPSEWSHAFGVSSLPVPTPIQTGDAYRVHRWYYGTDPAARKTAAVIYPPILTLFTGIELAGPHLDASAFGGGLFGLPPAGGGPTTPRVAYGYLGAPPRPNYSVPDDYTVIWWDAAARGADEEGVDGAGLYRYVDGGRRYSPDTVLGTPLPLFVRAGSVVRYVVPPPSSRAPTYPPWPGSPAAGH